MDSASTKLIVEILGLAARYSIPAVKAIIETWEKTTVTSEDIAGINDLLACAMDIGITIKEAVNE